MATIYIDIGHGGVDSTGSDTGTKGSLNGVTYKENEVNLNIGLKVIEVLKKYGHTVVTNRTENKNFGSLVGSYGRADSNLINSASYCKNTNCACMVSIHNNSYDSSTANGYVLIYKAGSEATDAVKTSSKKLCDYVEGQLKSTMSKNDVRKVLMSNGQDYYGILRLHDKPGVLIECGFMSNASDLDKIVNKYNDIGTEIANGIHLYLGGQIDNGGDECAKKLSALQKQLNERSNQVVMLQAENVLLKQKIGKVLEYDINKDGKSDENDAIYLLKHFIDPEKFPLDN